MALWCSGQACKHITGVMNSIPACHNKDAIGKESKGNHLIKSISLENIQSPVSGFRYTRHQVCDAAIGKVKCSFREKLHGCSHKRIQRGGNCERKQMEKKT